MKKVFAFFLVIIFSLILVSPVLAEDPPPIEDPMLIGGTIASSVKAQSDAQTQALGARAGFNMGLGVGDIVSTLIGVVLSVLGIIFLVLIVVSGYQWMMAGGNEETIKSAKKRLTNAVIGLVIVLAAWAITVFIFRNLPLGGNGNQDQGGLQGSP